MYQSDNDIVPILEEKDNLRRELHEYRQKWEEAQLELSEQNIALETLAKNVDQNKFMIIQKISEKLNFEILPVLNEIKNETNPDKIRILADLVIDKLILFIPSPKNPYSILTMLTPAEMSIAAMIKDGFKSEDIARMQHISLDTVKTHRRNIRKKLGLQNRRVDLKSYLESIFS